MAPTEGKRSLGLNGGGAAAAVPQQFYRKPSSPCLRPLVKKGVALGHVTSQSD